MIILHGDVGSITEGDILLASASGATILGFNARVETAARRLADIQNVEIRNYSIIYQLIEDIENTLAGLAAPLFQEVQEGTAEVRQVFEIRRGKVAGCVITNGRIRRGSMTRVVRGAEIVYEGPISTLRRFRDEVREVIHRPRMRHRHGGVHRIRGGRPDPRLPPRRTTALDSSRR